MRQHLGIWAAITFGLAIAFGTNTGTARADSAASAWTETEQTRLRLVAASTSTGQTRDMTLGLQFELQPGWKVYWRSPGDAGFPPQLDWTGSKNLASADIVWPAPYRFSVLGLQTVGYKDKVVLPIKAKTVAKGLGASLKARVRYLTCNDICIPYEANLALELPAGPMSPSPHAHAINRYSATVPGDGAAAGLELQSLTSWQKNDKAGLTLVASAADPFAVPDAFVEGPPGLGYGKPTVRLENGGQRAVIQVPVDGLDGLDDGKGRSLDQRIFVVTLVDGNRAAEKALMAKPGEPALASDPAVLTTETSGPSLLTILLFAVLGGLILNLMPCVLPVLSLKLLSLVKHGGGEARHVRAGFMASAAGIVTTFLAIAGILAALKSGGAAIGWGIQFQQPWFLIALTVLITAFACNLWGFFELRLPGAVGDASVRAADVQGPAGHFLQGVFATLLATPCSAPFLGTAVGFALAGSTANILLIFAALGLGLALPYLAVAAAPGLATWLPKPGPWMARLKVVLGFALAATGVWLLSVLAGVSGWPAAMAVGAVMAVFGLLLYLVHRPGRPGLKASAPAMLVAAVVAVALPGWLPAAPASSTNAQIDAVWQPFDEAAIPKLVADGKTVFVDVTADWCITCIVNKGVVLKNDRVRTLFTNGDVIAMQADWTKPSESISKYLARYGRFGIPFNIVYGPKSPDGIVLPELLTPGSVLAALENAAVPGSLAAKQ